MSTLWIYALVSEHPQGVLPEGLAGEALRVITVERVRAVVGSMSSIPSSGAAALTQHDAVVQKVAGMVGGIIPLRFGSSSVNEDALTVFLGDRVTELSEALALVSGREQMTLRVYGDPLPEPLASGAVPSTNVGSDHTGERYLTQRWLARASTHAVPEIASLQDALEPLVRAERVEHHVLPPLLASVFHLIDRGDSISYSRAVRSVVRQLGPVRVETSGPHAPYAFAPETPGLQHA